MRLPGFKTTNRQSFFWDEPLGNHGHARTVLGDFAEELTARLTRGRRYRTDSRADYCPDVFAFGTYFECKSAGRSNQTFVYAGRLEKDAAFAETRPLFYVVWHHAANTLIAADDRELKTLFLASLKAIYVVPFAEVRRLALESELTPLNSKYGHSDSNPTYGAGYRIPVSRLRSANHLAIGIEHVGRDRVLFDLMEAVA